MEKKPVTIEEVQELVKELIEDNYDTESAHQRYDDILERFIVYTPSNIALDYWMVKLITEARPKVGFWYA